MTPASSRRLRRSQHGAGVRFTRSASAVLEMRPSFCRMERILRSLSSSLSIQTCPCRAIHLLAASATRIANAAGQSVETAAFPQEGDKHYLGGGCFPLAGRVRPLSFG